MVEYITISEFAKRVGKSRQAIYSRINKDLRNYIIKEGHKLKISTDALYAVDSDVVSAYFKVLPKKEVAEVTPEVSDSEKPSGLAVLNDMSSFVKLIDKKEKQITDLLEIIKQQNKTIDKLMESQPKPSFWEKLISRKKVKTRDIKTISRKREKNCDIEGEIKDV